MQTISTKYTSATNTRGSRIVATSTNGDRVSIGYPHHLREGEQAHWEAANKLAQKLGWTGTMQAGATKTGYVFVFVDSREQFTIGA
jgi:hypothetical protein